MMILLIADVRRWRIGQPKSRVEPDPASRKKGVQSQFLSICTTLCEGGSIRFPEVRDD